MEDHLAADGTAAKVRVNGAPAEAMLLPCSSTGSSGKIHWRCTGGAAPVERSLSLDADVLGVEVKGKEVVVKAFVADDATRPPSVGAKREKRHMRSYAFEMNAGEGAAVAWAQRLSGGLDLLGRPKRLFVLINPYGGKKCAKKIYDAEIKPLFEAAGVTITVQETQYRGHAQEVASSIDLGEYDGIVIVSGDGVLVEVVNGIMQRTDWKEAIKIPIGMVPAGRGNSFFLVKILALEALVASNKKCGVVIFAGTGNGMAKSLLYSAPNEMYSVPNAVFAIIRGHKQSLDVCTITQGEKKIFSVLLMSWGLAADIDIESEKYRWMGSARLDFYALLRILNLRKYCGSISFVPAPGYEEHGDPVKQVDDSIESQGSGSGWRSIDGPFVAVWINNVQWGTESVLIAPKAEFSDGYVDAVIVRDIPKLDLLAMLLKMGDGSYVESKYVTYLKVSSFKLTPGQVVGDPEQGGIIDLDGEAISRGDGTYGKGQHQDVMAYGQSILLTVQQGLATLYCPK